MTEATTKVTNDTEQLEKQGKRIPTQEELLQMQLQYYPIFLHSIEKNLKKMKAKEIVPALIAALQFASNKQKAVWIKDNKVQGGKENTHELFMMLQEAIKIKAHVDTLRAVTAAKKAMEEAKETEAASDKDNNINEANKGENDGSVD